MNASWINPFIILGGALQSCGAAMNAQLFQSLGNKWLANAVSFALILAFFVCVFALFPNPLPTAEGLAKMPWWAPLGGALIMSLLLDHYGWFHLQVHALNLWRVMGALLMVGGIALIAKH